MIPIEPQLLCDPLVSPALQPEGADQLFLFLFHTRASLRSVRPLLCPFALESRPICHGFTLFPMRFCDEMQPGHRTSAEDEKVPEILEISAFFVPRSLAGFVGGSARQGVGPLQFRGFLTREGAAVFKAKFCRDFTQPPGGFRGPTCRNIWKRLRKSHLRPSRTSSGKVGLNF